MRSRAGIPIAIAAAYVLVRAAVPWEELAKLSPTFTALVYLAVLMLIQVGFVINIASLQLNGKSALGLLGMGTICVATAMLLTANLRAHAGIPVSVLLSVSIFRNLAFMTFAAALGYVVSFIVREPNILLPAAVFAGLVDYWSVTIGPLSQILEKKPGVVASVAVQMPGLGPAIPGTMIGVGDFVFLGLFFAVLYRFAMNTRLAFWVGYAFLTASILIVIRFGGAIPALVPMGLAIIVTNMRFFKLKRDELLATLYVGAFLLVVFVASRMFLFRQ